MYFDHSATTPVHPEVQKLITATQADIYGNPSSNHFLGRKARLSLEKSSFKWPFKVTGTAFK